jgi:hypothetical protein
MNDFLKYLFQGDPLKAASNLIENSNFDDRNNDKEIPVSISLLLLAAVFLTFKKTLY